MNMKKIETVILQNLVHSEDYMRKVIPFLKRDYFTETLDSKVYEYISKFIEEYNSTPNIDAPIIAAQNDKSLSDDQYKEVIKLVQTLENSEVS